MSGTTGEHIQGLGPTEKKRREQEGRERTERAEIDARYSLGIDDRIRISTLDAGDPEIAAYNGFRAVQGQIIADERVKRQKAEEAARRHVEIGSIRAHLPVEAILGIEEQPEEYLGPSDMPGGAPGEG